MTYMFDRIIENNIDILEKYFYGHFHYSDNIQYKGITMKLLNINQICSIL